MLDAAIQESPRTDLSLTTTRLFRGAGNAFHAKGEFSNPAVTSTSPINVDHADHVDKGLLGELDAHVNGRRSYTLLYLSALAQAARGSNGGEGVSQDLVDQVSKLYVLFC